MTKDVSYLKPYQYKPKHTDEDLQIIRDELAKETPIEQIFAIMKNRRPDVHAMTVWRWVEKIALEMGKK